MAFVNCFENSYRWLLSVSIHTPALTHIHTYIHKVEPTVTCIDYDKLRKQEKILFYDDVLLFEDELADNGSAVLRVKIVRP